LYNNLINEFPYIPLPKLNKKDNLLNNLKNEYNNEFFDEQLKLITFFLNFTNNHNVLLESNSLKQFFCKDVKIYTIDKTKEFYTTKEVPISTKFNTKFKDFFSKIL